MKKISLKTRLALGEPWKVILPESAKRALKIHSINPMLTENLEVVASKFGESLITAREIYIITGFPYNDLFESDGPLGAVLVAFLCTIFNCPCYICTEKELLPTMSALVKKIETLNIHPKFSQSLNQIHYADISCITSFENTTLIAIERPGKNDNGKYKSMNGTDISDLIFPIDKLIKKYPPEVFFAIGDGGNELGLGKYKKSVDSVFARLESIAAISEADSVILGCTSNFGALCLVYEVLTQHNMVGEWNYTPQKEREMLTILNSWGIYDGVTGESETTDGIPRSLSDKMINELNLLYIN
jgi:hypothetical protein